MGYRRDEEQVTYKCSTTTALYTGRSCRLSVLSNEAVRQSCPRETPTQHTTSVQIRCNIHPYLTTGPRYVPIIVVAINNHYKLSLGTCTSAIDVVPEIQEQITN